MPVYRLWKAVFRQPSGGTKKPPACVKLESAALNELVAQLVEHRPFMALVLGSSPSELTTHLWAADFPTADFPTADFPTKDSARIHPHYLRGLLMRQLFLPLNGNACRVLRFRADLRRAARNASRQPRAV